MTNKLTNKETTQLKKLVKNKVGVEIGCEIGDITKIIASSCKKVIAIDTFNVLKSNKTDKKGIDKFIDNTNMIKNISYIESYPFLAVKVFNKHELDFVFLNGYQTEQPLIEIIQFFYPKLKHGGVLILHDYTNEERPDVKTVFNLFFEKYDGITDSMVWNVKTSDFNEQRNTTI